MMAEASSLTSGYSAADDLSLHIPQSPHLERVHIRERSSSENDLSAGSPQCLSFLGVSAGIVDLERDPTVKVSWDIKEDVSAGDWIGLYSSGMLEGSVFLPSARRV